MISGILLAVFANALWAIAFVAPLLLPTFSPIEITLGRYSVFAVSSIVVLIYAFMRTPNQIGRMIASPKMWGMALILTALGHIVYYGALSTGLRMAGAAIPTLIIGMLPLLMSLIGAMMSRNVPWRALAVSLGVIAAGLGLVQFGGAHGAGILVDSGGPDYLTGLAFTVLALASWTTFGVLNASYLQRHSSINMVAWTCMVGISIVPLLLVLVSATEGFQIFQDLWNRPYTELFMFLMISLVMGIGTSWIGTWAWNAASAVLPTTLLGQLIVVETVMALTFAAAVHEALPSVPVLVGALLLVLGVLSGIRTSIKNAPRQAPETLESGPINVI